MDFYEALRSGMTAEEITESFNKELEEAVKRVEEDREAKRRKAAEEEQKAKKKAALSAARQKAAAEIIEYFKTLFEVEGIETADIFFPNGELTNVFCHLLEESEKDFCAKQDLAKVLKAVVKNNFAQKKDTVKRFYTGDSNDKDDDTILSNFLSDLFKE